MPELGTGEAAAGARFARVLRPRPAREDYNAPATVDFFGGISALGGVQSPTVGEGPPPWVRAAAPAPRAAPPAHTRPPILSCTRPIGQDLAISENRGWGASLEQPRRAGRLEIIERRHNAGASITGAARA